MIVDNEKDLQALIEKWQGILRLQDWKITGKLTYRHDLDGDWGQHKSVLCHKESTVEIARPDEGMNGHPCKCDHEETVIHELIHIHLLELGDHIRLEQAANMLTSALLGLHRNNKCR